MSPLPHGEGAIGSPESPPALSLAGRWIETEVVMPLRKISPRERLGRSKRQVRPDRRAKVLNRLLEHRLIKRVSFEEYREKVRDVYDGPQGAMLATCSMLSLHTAFGERLFRERKFDLRGARRILDVGSGAGQIARHVLKYADPTSRHDLLRSVAGDAPPGAEPSEERPARVRRGRPDPAALRRRLLRLRHLRLCPGAPARRQAGPGRAEPGDDAAGEDAAADHGGQFLGAWTSRFWCCRTYNRREFARICEGLGLAWHQELWFTRMHKVLRAGGICVELVKE